MGADGLGRDHELLGDLKAGGAERDKRHNLALARRQLAESGGGRRLLLRLDRDDDRDRDVAAAEVDLSQGVLDAHT